MPFAYFGAKHGLAGKYPAPRHSTVIEPFAGSAGYSMHHIRWLDRVVLYDADPVLCDLWERVKTLTVADLDAMEREAATAERTAEPLIGFIGGGTAVEAMLAGKDRQVTPRMRHDFGRIVRPRIQRALPYLHRVEIVNGTYHDVPNIEATWHIDPPYQPLRTDYTTERYGAGNVYRFSGIDYDHLADWCQSRRGFVMVCEQSPAEWLPFTQFAMQNNGSTRSTQRAEVIWRSDQQQMQLFDGL